jgi:Na+/melibiose symporter-like transporter
MTLLTLGGRLHAKSVAFAATSLGSHLINPVFYFYYVKVYLNRFHVTEPWFQMAQVIFMIWNAVNDPLFGCLQDNARFLPAMRSRRHSILYGAPFFVFAFVSAWFPWSDYEATGSDAPEPWVAGLQLTCALCLYDALFTFVLLAQCALLAELATDQVDRVRLIRYSHAASLIGSTSVLLCDAASGGLADFDRFRMVCCGLGVAAGACFVYTGLKAHTQFDRHDVTGGNGGGTSPSVVDVDQKPLAGIVSQRDDRDTASVGAVLRQTAQIFAQRSFVSFVLTNLCQIYHTTFLTNFANIIGERLIGDALSSTAKSFLYGSLFLVPQVINKLQTLFGIKVLSVACS